MMQVKYVLFVIYCAVLLLLHMVDSQEYCKFVGNFMKNAHCTPRDSNRTFDYVPRISVRIRLLNLNEQPLKQLPRNAFANISSQNELIWAMLENCQIQHIDVDAFMNLGSLKHLSISANPITRLETGTLQHTKLLVTLYMLSNNFDKLQTGLFHNLVHLEEVHLKNSSIFIIESDTFRKTPSLYWIDVEDNLLEYLSPLFTDKFMNISRLYARGNPWNCDCYLREFYEKNKVRKGSFGNPKPICQNPPGFRGMKIADLTSNAFICNAQIISPKNDTTVVTLGSNVTLSCVVYGDPVPDIEWHKGSKLIAKYNGSRSTYLNIHYLDYTFIVQEEDLGVYYCSAYNTHEIEKSSTTLTMDAVTK